MDAPERPAAERFRWGLLVGETLRRPRAFQPIGLDVVDVEVIPDLSGAPENMWAWLIFSSRADASAARVRSDEVRTYAAGLLGAAGYPDDALGTFKTYYTSTDEIEAGGGRLVFFK